MFSNCEIYGFSGKLRTGKNFVAEQIFLPMLKPLPTAVLALADHFKVDVCSKDGVAYSKVFEKKDDATRKLLQHRGTEEGRLKYGDQIWIKTLETWMNVFKSRGVRRFIITDVRFPNEVQWLKSHGGKIFRIVAPCRNDAGLRDEAKGNADMYELIKGHPSETALDGYTWFDYVLDNDYSSIDDIWNKVSRIVDSLGPCFDCVVFCDLDDTICLCKEHYMAIALRIADKYKLPREEFLRLFGEYSKTFHLTYFTKTIFGENLAEIVGRMRATTAHERADIVQESLAVFEQNYAFLSPDIPSVLEQLAKDAKLVIFTLGDHTVQMKKIARLGLYGKYDVEIFAHKDENMFRHLLQKYPAKTSVMIGDSLARDIVPAMEAGVNQCYHISSRTTISHSRVHTFAQLDSSLVQHLKKTIKL